MPDNEVFGFGEDKYNRLWMSTFNGSLCYYKDGIIHTERDKPFLRIPRKVAFIASIMNEYDGSVTIKFYQSSSFANIIGETIHLFDAKQVNEAPLKFMQVRKVAPDKYEITGSTETFIWDTSGRVTNTRQNAYSFCGTFPMNDRIYLVDTTYTVVSNNRMLVHVPTPANTSIIAVFEDSIHHKTMVGTYNGLRIFPEDRLLFQDHIISSITPDRSGNYWISTTNAGVFCLNAGYTHYRTFDNPDKTLVKYARILKGQLYFLTQKGNIYTIKNDSIRQLFNISQYKSDFNKRHTEYPYYEQDGEQLKKRIISSARRIHEEPNNASIAAYLDTNLNFYHISGWDNLILDKLNSQTASVKTRLPFKYKGAMKNITVTDSAIYIKAYVEIFYISRRAWEKQDPYAFHLVQPNKKRERLFGWAQDHDGGIWFSTVDSLYKIRDSTITVQKEYGAPGLRKFGIWNGFLMGYKHDNTLQICHLDANRKLVIDTSINGSSIWDDFYQIDSTHILISSNDKYRMVTLTHPGRKDGFHIQTVESRFIPVQSEFVCADSNVSYFFNNGTITRLDTKRLFDAPAQPVVYFLSLQTKNKIYSASQNGPITIPYSDANDIQLNYIPLSYSGGDLRCEYSISQDSTTNWRSIDEATINLYLTRSGNYYVRVRARTLSDSYSPVAILQFTIQKPFWTTWWFILIASVIVVVLIWWTTFSIARGMLRKKQKAYEADMKYQRMEFKALNALMNPHFIFNTLNNIQNLFKNQQNKADEYFVTFSRLIRQNMQNVTKDTISLEQELNLVANYLKLEKLRFDEFVNYKIDVDPELDLDNIFIPPLLIQPLVENAIRHGLLPKQSMDNLVTVHVYEKEKSLFIEITDNGVGLSGKSSHIDPQHESLGLSNLRKRIEHMNRTRTEKMTFDLIEQKDEKGRIGGTLARIEIASDRW
ncbi:sensor histidine kinase [Taibaiella soli]|uniref:Signal transduction histidine kinase internal region domain-containing protein n=1 Tax=Taibaiella soli TaxID=1649169 RepID=A0A2W2BMW9_9BACT|nr:histidine kinase [Taibaiella soli]PZF74806.1 hypothetical protein DN068_01000 [Taibaiella soli]